MKPCCFFIASIVFAAILYGDETIWLEAERFENPGGWSADSQFIDQMGSTYLLATGIGKPVADAVTTFQVDEPGEYKLWLRTKDWYPSHHPGRFTVILDGKELSTVYGASGQTGWQWEQVETVKLDAGKHELRLHDLTGYYGRCDAVVLSKKTDWKPLPGNRPITLNISEQATFDVVVVGGGLAGCTAAVAAARNGASVALIQDRPVLGGNASTEVLVPPVGLWSAGAPPNDANETGLIEEYRTAGKQRTEEGKLYSSRLLRWVKNESKLKLFLNTRAVGVSMNSDGTRIEEIKAVDTIRGLQTRFRGAQFIDCTGDGNLGASAGAEFRHGKESFDQHQEPWAPQEQTRLTMGSGIKFATGFAKEPKHFKGEAWMYQFPTCESIPKNRHPRFTTTNVEWQWIIELGGMRDTIQDAEEIRDDLLRLNLGLWDHLKNHCQEHGTDGGNQRHAASDTSDQRERVVLSGAEAPSRPTVLPFAEMLWLGHVAGKRESRRLIGDYVLSQNDIGSQELFPDRVAFGGWVCDDHYSEGFFHDGQPGLHHDHPEAAFPRQYFSIPLRTLYSKNVPNLWMAGRNLSATHLGLSNTRVMLTNALLGHAVGTASAIAVQKKVGPRELCEKYIGDVQQQLLKEGSYLIDLPGKDPNDLARTAKLTASSEEADYPVSKIVDGFSRLNGKDPSSWKPLVDAETPHGVEFSWENPVKFNIVQIAFQTKTQAPKTFSLQIFKDGDWADVFRLEDNRHRRLVLPVGDVETTRFRFTEFQAAAVCEIRIYDEPKEIVESAQRAFDNMRLPDVGPFFPWETGDEEYSHLMPPPEEAKLGLFFFAAEADAVGDWTESTWGNVYFGNGSYHDGNDGKGSRTLTFRPGAKMSGDEPKKFEVRFAYVSTDNRASNVPIIVKHVGGEEKIVVDEKKKPAGDERFLSLGTWTFDKKSFVRIENAATNGFVSVDALLFVP